MQGLTANEVAAKTGLSNAWVRRVFCEDRTGKRTHWRNSHIKIYEDFGSTKVIFTSLDLRLRERILRSDQLEMKFNESEKQ